MTRATLPFEIQTLEWIACNRPEQFDIPARSGSFEIIWIKNASGTYMVDLEKHKIGENEVYCIEAGQLYLLQPDANPKGYYVSFTAQFLFQAADNARFIFRDEEHAGRGMAGIIGADEELGSEMESIMDKLIKESANHSELRTEILRGLLKLLLIYLARRLKVNAPEVVADRNTRLLRKFMNLMESNLKKQRTISQYAGELGITANYLNCIIKKITGFPASYHIQQRKVLEAKRQLMYYGNSMKEIAYSLGFDDTSHFSRFFKNNTGSNFQDFKKELFVKQPEMFGHLPHPS